MIRPMPDDFPEIAAQMKTAAKVARHYRSSRRVAARWFAERGIKLMRSTPPPKPRIDMPPDFPAYAPTMTKAQLSRRFDVAISVINRWLDETGLAAKSGKREAIIQTWKSDIPPPKRETDYDLAAEYLRRFMPVNRCNSQGKYDPNGFYFRTGSTVMTFPETIERANKMRARQHA